MNETPLYVLDISPSSLRLGFLFHFVKQNRLYQRLKKQKKELVNLAVFEGEKVITELSDEEIYNIFSLGNA